MPRTYYYGARSRIASRRAKGPYRTRSPRTGASRYAITPLRPTRTPGQGYLRVLRRVGRVGIENTGGGTVAVVGTNTNTLINLGTPVIAPVGGGYIVPFALQFSLGQVIDSTELTALFDQYRIRAVDVRVRYLSNTSTVSGTSFLPAILWGPEYDDNLPSVGIRPRADTIMHSFASDSVEARLCIRPRPAPVVLDAPLPGYMVPDRPQWIDSAYPNVAHYGIKGEIQNMVLPADAESSTFSFEVIFDIECKGSH